MKNRIVFVDEAQHELRPLLMELEMQGIGVSYFSTADECVADVLAGNQAALYILDITLISESIFPDKLTDQKLYTGLILGKVVREVFQDVPIVFYSAIGMETGIRYTENTIRAIGNSRLLRKQDISSPFEFWEKISPILESGDATEKKNKFLSALSAGAVLKPSVFGLGFDVKEFVKELRRKQG